MANDMTNEERIAQLEAQLEEVSTKQHDLSLLLAQAERDQWQGRIEDLEVQLHLGAMEGNDRARELMDRLSSRWSEARGHFDVAATTAVDVGATLRGGLQSAVRDVRQALLESRSKITS